MTDLATRIQFDLNCVNLILPWQHLPVIAQPVRPRREDAASANHFMLCSLRFVFWAALVALYWALALWQMLRKVLLDFQSKRLGAFLGFR
jgi:hypothetical protein